MNGAALSLPTRTDTWRYTVCGLLLLATMLNYMDRLTLSQLGKPICDEFGLSKTQYGLIDSGFSLAFATGAITFGVLVDRLGPRWLYPLVLIGWSLAGIATGFADRIGALFPSGLVQSLNLADAEISDESAQAYLGFMVCRIVLGFFEAGHWPCALVTTQRILARKDRTFGNSILQSGAALGAVLTPLIVLALLPSVLPGEGLPAGAWRSPFLAIGLLGMLWIVPWLALVRGSDLRRAGPAEDTTAADAEPMLEQRQVWRLFAVLVVIVITINATWQFFRVWLPMFLMEQHDYSLDAAGWFTSAYYVSTDVGCIAVGLIVKWLADRGWDVHRARVLTFAACTGLTLLSLFVVTLRGPLLLIVMLLIGAGALGLFPNYYAFTQELSRRHQGKITGILGTAAWVGTAALQYFVGGSVDAAKAAGAPNPYAAGIIVAGLAPLPALLALLLFWPRRKV